MICSVKTTPYFAASIVVEEADLPIVRTVKASPLLWLLALAQAHARSATVLVDEFDASHF